MTCDSKINLYAYIHFDYFFLVYFYILKMFNKMNIHVISNMQSYMNSDQT